MLLITNCLVVFIAILHLWFLTLEMFLWQKPIGLRTFRNSVESAKATSVLAANQGLYNGFLAAGLLASFLFTSSEVTHAFQFFFLICVIVAGLFGAWTVSRKIFFVQALPAILALLLLAAF